nr:MAG TPA: hypothetical protein [Caudoviricetes sp.]
MGVFHFSVSGEFITRFARERFCETGDVQTGIDILIKAFSGFPNDLAREVVKGKKKLVGINEVTVEDDDKEIEPYRWIKPNDIKECLCGWISPDGKVYGCEDYTETTEHTTIAEELILSERVPDTEMSNDRSVEVAGYIKFQPLLIVAGCKPALITEAQREKVILFMKSHALSSIQIGWSLNRFIKLGEIKAMDLLQFANHVTH